MRKINKILIFWNLVPLVILGTVVFLTVDQLPKAKQDAVMMGVCIFCVLGLISMAKNSPETRKWWSG